MYHTSKCQVDDVQHVPTYNHCLSKTICNPPQPKCYLGDFDYCPGITSLKERYAFNKLIAESQQQTTSTINYAPNYPPPSIN